MEEIEVGRDAHKYDLEEYYLPTVIRKILKTTKPTEVVQVRSNRRDKIIPYFQDPNGIFSQELLNSFEKEVVFTFCLVAFEQKDYIFKIPQAEKITRLQFLKQIATDFFKMNRLKKALKCYNKVHMYFRTKDAKNNF